MKKKVLLLITILAMVLTVSTPMAFADETATPSATGLEVSKTAQANNDGTYTISLESYATGSKIITETTTTVPTDIILVLDQSGSMAYDFTVTSYDAYTGSSVEDYYNQALEALYVQLPNGSYAPVTVSRNNTLTNPVQTTKTNSDYYNSSGVTHYHKCADGTYGELSISDISFFVVLAYVYVCDNCGEYEISSILDGGLNLGSTIPDMASEIYTASSVSTTYTFSYVDENGNTVTAENVTSVPTGEDWQQFYVPKTNTESTRLAALKDSVSAFTNTVKEKATADNVDHRIAIVGFASVSGNGDNSEILSVSGNNSGSVGVAYGELENSDYAAALQDMSTIAGQTMISNAVAALAAEGATRVDVGMEMANNIFANDPKAGSGELRNRVVIVFTDGVPTNQSEFSDTVANNAISYGNTAKTTHGATIYTVGIFEGADSTSAGNQNGNDTQKANWFMQTLSSNNGTVRTPSYYLSASNSTALTNIFQSISQNIETGGSSTTLGGEAVIKDIIAPAFTLPEGADASDITLSTYACTGVDANGAYTWGEASAAAGVTATISSSGSDATTTNNTVNVTGFNFSENWVGTETVNGVSQPHGSKLVITFTVKARDGFLGGNGVYTNTSAGIYADDEAGEPLVEFERPQVNVPIANVTVTAADYNVYLTGDITAEQMNDGVTAKCGAVSLDPTKTNYGLYNWQTEYVTISMTELTAKNDIVSDITYTVSCTVAPKTASAADDAATAESDSATGNINVYKPEITFNDTVIYLGETPNYANNGGTVAWKHGTDIADQDAMGTPPAVTLSYDPSAGKFEADTYVNVTVTIGGADHTGNTTFVHDLCNEPGCSFNSANGEFIVHVRNCTLTITKSGANSGDSFIFTVTGPNGFSRQVVITGNGSVTLTGLRIGTYTVTEDTSWSWRYTTENGTQTANITAENTSVTITVTNTYSNDQWLGDETAAENVFEKN